MADTTYRDAYGSLIRYEDVVLDASANRRIPKSIPADGTGAILFSAENPGRVAGTLTVKPDGSTGTDHSANAAAVPSDATLLLTIPANANRVNVEVQNQSANPLQVVRDDGNGAQRSSVLLTGVGPNQQGAGWSSSTFKGRLRVYGPAGSQVSAFQD